MFARGAVVTRHIELPTTPIPDGEVDLVVRGLTPRCEPGSFRAQIDAEKRLVLSITSEIVAPAGPLPVASDETKLVELKFKLQRVKAEIERLENERQQLQKQFPDPALRTTSLCEKVDERMADAVATCALLSDVQLDLSTRQLTLEGQLAELNLAKSAMELLVSQASTSQRAGESQPSRCATLRMTGSGPIADLRLTYVVPAARFFPAYTLRLLDGARRATWSIDAHVAQCSGEDWNGARLSLSTADLIYDASLPELPSLRFGRLQAAPRRGYRPPPEGLDRLFAGYDRGFANQPPPVPSETRSPSKTKKETVDFDDSLSDEPTWATQADVVEKELEKKLSRGRAEPSAPPALPPAEPMTRSPAPAPQSVMASGAMPFLPGAPPAPKPVARAAPSDGSERAKRSIAREAPMLEEGAAEAAASFGGLGGGGLGADAAPADNIEPQDVWLDFDRLQLAGPEQSRSRGKLVLRSDEQTAKQNRRAMRVMEQLEIPSGLFDPLVSRGQFDHRYDAEGLLKIPSDGKLHRVAVLGANGVPHQRLISVPRERSEVYREVELQNPCDAPLLAGPVDVFVEGALLTTDSVSHVDRGGSLRVGMGVEDRVKIARNIRAEEESTGLLGGSTAMTHFVSLDISSSLGQPAQIDIYERLPVSDDKNLTVELIHERPVHTPYDQTDRGAPVRRGMRWRVTLPPGGKTKIEYHYRLVFSAKTEIIGGNRRE